MSEKPEQKSENAEQLAQDIQATRHELAETVSALVEKTDVRRQATKGLVRLRLRLQESLARARVASRQLTARKKS
jgi:Protein of unknown function (DUF3618)